MRKYFQIEVQPWEAERLKVLIGRSRGKGVELHNVTRQLNWVISEHHDDVVAAFTKQHGRAPSTPEEAKEWCSDVSIAEALFGPREQWSKRRFRTIDGGKNEGGPFGR